MELHTPIAISKVSKVKPSYSDSHCPLERGLVTLLCVFWSKRGMLNAW